MKATSATPLTRLPSAALVWLDGRLSTKVVRFPALSILEMREPVALPEYGPTGGTTTQSGSAGGGLAPPTPPSATYRFASGPTSRPRGLLSPSAKTVTLACATGGLGFAASEAANGSPSATAPEGAATADESCRVRS